MGGRCHRHRRAWCRWGGTGVTLGSVANELLSESSVPVLLVHDKPEVLSAECEPNESRARGRPALHIVRTTPSKTSG
jgi:hypothetical protein